MADNFEATVLFESLRYDLVVEESLWRSEFLSIDLKLLPILLSLPVDNLESPRDLIYLKFELVDTVGPLIVLNGGLFVAPLELLSVLEGLNLYFLW